MAPSGRSTSSTIEMSVEAEVTCRSAASTTPMATASWMGSSDAQANVVAPEIRAGQPARHTVEMSCGLMLDELIRISNPPRAGIATSETTPERTTTTAIVKAPESMTAQRPLPPDETFNTVPLSEPPTGSPRNSPDVTLPAPCAMKSRDIEIRPPDALDTLWLTPAPCTAPTIAIEIAPVTTALDSADREGIEGSGNLPSMCPRSPTTAMESRFAITTTRLGTTRATRVDTFFAGVLRRAIPMATVLAAIASVGR